MDISTPTGRVSTWLARFDQALSSADPAALKTRCSRTTATGAISSR
jgi:hypothetical protein